VNESENIRTLHKLERLEQGIMYLRGPRRYLRIIAKRVAYLRRKQAELPATAKARNFIVEEVDASLWLLAQYASFTGYDVRAVLCEKEHQPMDLDRFDKIAAAIAYARAHLQNKPEGVK
jgi:hypothetical protein